MRVHKRKCLTSLVFCLQCCYLNKLNAIIAPVEGFLHAQDYEWKRSHYTHIGSVSTLFPSGATFDDLRREYHSHVEFRAGIPETRGGNYNI